MKSQDTSRPSEGPVAGRALSETMQMLADRLSLERARADRYQEECARMRRTQKADYLWFLENLELRAEVEALRDQLNEPVLLTEWQQKCADVETLRRAGTHAYLVLSKMGWEDTQIAAAMLRDALAASSGGEAKP